MNPGNIEYPGSFTEDLSTKVGVAITITTTAAGIVLIMEFLPCGHLTNGLPLQQNHLPSKE